MFFTKAPPQRASAVHEDGFSFLSWKIKTVLAATVILCGGGIAAQFPSTTTPEERIADSSAVSKSTTEENFANLDQDTSESGGFVYSQPQRQYADSAAIAAEDTRKVGNFSLSRPAGPIAKYIPPPKMGEETETTAPPGPAESLTANKPRLASFPVFDTIDYSGFEKTAVDLPLARWNPLFDKAPPLSEMPSRPLPVAEENKVVAAKPEIRSGETVTDAIIDFDTLVPANSQLENTIRETVIEAMIDADALVPTQQMATDSVQEINAVIPDEFLVPAGK